MADQDLHALAELQQSPTVELWHAELIRIYEGEREAHIIHLGSAEEYIEHILLFARDRAASLATFSSALERAVGSWRPTADLRADGALLWLQLIRRYAPAVGFSRLLEITSVLRAGGLKDSASLALFQTALGALESYYPAAPHDSQRDQGFNAYVKLLEACLDYEPVQGHASRRLLEVGVVTAGQDTLMMVLSRRPTILNDVLGIHLGPVRQSQPLGQVQTLYGACVQLGLESQFEEAARSWSATITRHQQGVTLTTADDRHVELVSEVHLDPWTMGSFNRINLQGRKAFDKRLSRLES